MWCDVVQWWVSCQSCVESCVRYGSYSIHFVPVRRELFDLARSDVMILSFSRCQGSCPSCVLFHWVYMTLSSFVMFNDRSPNHACFRFFVRLLRSFGQYEMWCCDLYMDSLLCKPPIIVS